MRPYRVKVTVRNNLLLSAIEAAGYKSQTAFAKSAGIDLTQLNALVGLRTPPIGEEGRFSPAANAVMEALGACPSDLWSDEQLTMKLKRNSGERAVEYDVINHLLEAHQEAMLLPDPEQLAMEAETKKVVDSVLDTLTERETRILRSRFIDDEKTLKMLGEEEGVTGARIREIEQNAFRKIRNPTRAAILEMAGLKEPEKKQGAGDGQRSA